MVTSDGDAALESEYKGTCHMGMLLDCAFWFKILTDGNVLVLCLRADTVLMRKRGAYNGCRCSTDNLMDMSDWPHNGIAIVASKNKDQYALCVSIRVYTALD